MSHDTPTSAELLPCPFCGDDPLLDEIEAHTHGIAGLAGFMPDHPGSFTIECPTTNCCGMIADTRAEAIAAWNRRAAMQTTEPVKRRDVFAICDAYESGMGHGLQLDGHKSGAIFGNPECGKAYEIGYEEGEERARKPVAPDRAPSTDTHRRRAFDASPLDDYAAKAKTSNPSNLVQQLSNLLGDWDNGSKSSLNTCHAINDLLTVTQKQDEQTKQ